MPSVSLQLLSVVDNAHRKRVWMFLLTDRDDEYMVRCSNSDCPLGVWYHLSCVQLMEPPDGDWWCCAECEQTAQSMFCRCKQLDRSAAQVVCCNEKCKNGAKFHLDCVGLQQAPACLCLL